MNDWASQVPTATAFAACVAAGGILVQVRSIARTLQDVSKRLDKLAEDKVSELERRLNAIERWTAGHDEQARERWEQVRPKGHE